MENLGLNAFRIKNGRLLDADSSSASSGIFRSSGPDTSAYSIQQVNNGFIFKQNPAFTGRKSCLFLNSEQMTLKQMTGSFELTQRAKSTLRSVWQGQQVNCSSER